LVFAVFFATFIEANFRIRVLANGCFYVLFGRYTSQNGTVHIVLERTMEEQLLTWHVAYLAMFRFLERQYELGSHELGGMLGGMALLPGGGSADPAMLEDWRASVNEALAGQVNANLELGK
jgi:hypothetical protein